MLKNQNRGSEFRADINGLRAWAVAAVVLYHFGVSGLGGGFVGVDVFFVISGLLMTGIVVEGLEKGSFSVLGFYMARARRIVPALIVLCAVLICLGWWLILPADYQRLAWHALSSLVFVSNMVFWKEAGYFDVHSHDKWLLHTWSLSVEWQFYLVLPLVLWGLWKCLPGRRSATWAMAIGLVISLGLCIAVTPSKPSTAFYLLPTRAWEMLAGGLVYLLAGHTALAERHRRALELCGLGLIVASVLSFNAGSAWPGWRAVLPVLGSALVLMSCRTQSVWTCNPLAQWVGSRSYSLYLWHWPIVVALRYAERHSAPWAVAAGLALTCVLGHLSFHWIETPARRLFSRLSFGSGVGALAVTAAIVAVGCGAVWFKNGVAGRFDTGIEQTSQAALDRNLRRADCHAGKGVASPSCLYGTGPLKAIVLGDSHADAVMSAVAASVPSDAPGSVMQWSYSACPIIQGAHRTALDPTNECAGFVDWALAQLEKVPSDVPVVVVNRHGQYAFGKPIEGPANVPWVYFSRPYATSEPAFLQEYATHLTRTACTLAKHHRVFLVRPIPEMNVDVPGTARAMLWGQNSEVTVPLADYRRRNAIVWAAQDAARDQCGVQILDPLPYLCRGADCYGKEAGRPLYYDDNHLSEHGNKLLVPMFAKVFGGS